MRVLHLGKYWRKDGGIETHVKTLCKNLASAGVDVVNLVSSIDSSGKQFEIDGYTVVESPSMGVYFSTSISPRMLLDARRLHSEHAFDLIHLHFPDPMSHLASLALPPAIPRVITWHSDIVKQQHLLKLYRPFQIKEIMRSKAIIAATQSHFNSSTQVPTQYPATQKYVIPFGIEFSWLELTPAVAVKAKIIQAQARGRFIVFALGRHVEYKGFDVLIRAIQHTSAYLVLGGEGPLTTQLKTLARLLGLSERISFVGRLNEAELAANYHACDVFCLPSVTTNEAFGIVQVEAMMCGKPVVCTQLNNGVNEVNPHLVTGLVVEKNNPYLLASAIEKLSQNRKLCMELGQAGQINAKRNYTVKKMTSRHIEIYRDLS